MIVFQFIYKDLNIYVQKRGIAVCNDSRIKLRQDIKHSRANYPFCKYCDFIDAGLRMDAVDDVLNGREMHGARQSLTRKK